MLRRFLFALGALPTPWAAFVIAADAALVRLRLATGTEPAGYRADLGPGTAPHPGGYRGHAADVPAPNHHRD